MAGCIGKIGTIVDLFCQGYERSVGVPRCLHAFGVGDMVIGMDTSIRHEHVCQEFVCCLIGVSNVLLVEGADEDVVNGVDQELFEGGFYVAVAVEFE